MTNDDDDKNSNKPDSETGERYRILIEFAHRHLDFLIADLESVLCMNGILRDRDYRVEPLLNQHVFEQAIMDKSAACFEEDEDERFRGSKRPFTILSFPLDSKWLSTTTSTASPPTLDQQSTASSSEPNHTSDKIGALILERCVLVRSVIELWAMAPTIPECAAHVQTWSTASAVGQRLVGNRLQSSASWKVSIHTLGSTYTREEQAVMREHFRFLDFPGPVTMKNPDNDYVLIREAEIDKMGGAMFPRHDFRKQIIPENDARPPLCCYFGRSLCGPRSLKGRGNVQTYSLKKRPYLGPTSMDAELSFVMTNLGHVRKGHVVLDPFVGTGSILLSCALRGAYCVGTDIDIRVLRGKSADENVFANFRQHQLPRPDLIRSDNAMYTRHFRTASGPLYDAIVCDPPYGIRAGARQTGARSGDNVRPLTDEERQDHIPQTKPYPVSNVMEDLLDMAALTLIMGGRLVYIIPSFRDFDEETDLPRHPCLKTVHICYQPLSMELGRRMVAMEKIAQYDDACQDKYREQIWKNGPESAEKCANIREKIIEAAKQKPGYEDKAASRRQKRKENKQARKRAKLESA